MYWGCTNEQIGPSPYFHGAFNPGEETDTKM